MMSILRYRTVSAHTVNELDQKVENLATEGFILAGIQYHATFKPHHASADIESAFFQPMQLLAPAASEATGFRIDLATEGKKPPANPAKKEEVPPMKVLKDALKITLKDDGTGEGKLIPTDAAGNDTDSFPSGMAVPTWASSDPAVAVTSAPDGLSSTLKATGALAQGVIITVATTLGDGSPFSAQSDSFDVVPDAAVGFRIILSSDAASQAKK